ncbi:hypothetical protein SMC26_25835 [Actinomadura fulvescens]|uniref:hypothetical protein n=1 Tax=Actinomadura fulvescens TaxID=46160 RepID=UPI0031D6B67B
MSVLSSSPPALRRGQHAPKAWVESPLQLLSAVEAHHAGLLGHGTEVVLRSGVDPLVATAAEVERLGPHRGLAGVHVGTRVPLPAGTGTLVIGDAFSGTVQRRLLTLRAQRLVIADDGLATIHLLELLAAPDPRPLIRARARPTMARQALGLAAATRLRALGRAGRVVVFTALPVPEELRTAVTAHGIEVVAHDFPWLRSRPAGPPPQERQVVLGSSLVANGLVHRERYLEWIAGLAAVEPIAYRPHRREDPADLAELRRDPRVSVAEPGPPVEVCLRGLTREHRVISLPSTALTSLRLVLRGNGTTIEGVTVPAEWWTERADAALREHLSLFLDGPGTTR